MSLWKSTWKPYSLANSIITLGLIFCFVADWYRLDLMTPSLSTNLLVRLVTISSFLSLSVSKFLTNWIFLVFEIGIKRLNIFLLFLSVLSSTIFKVCLDLIFLVSFLLKIENIFFISSSFTENSLRMSLSVCPLLTE